MSRLLTAKEAAERMRCSLSLVYSLVAAGRLRHHRVGLGRGKVLVPEVAIAEYLEASTMEPPAPVRKLRHLNI